MKKFIYLCLMLMVSSLGVSATPVILFTPETSTTFTLPTTESTFVQYLLTNRSKITHTLVMKAITGIQPISVGDGVCSDPIVLSGHASCLLLLAVDGSRISTGGVHGGPVVCQEGPSEQPNPNFCYQPSLANSLDISVENITEFIIDSSAGAHGSIDPNGETTVSAGGDLDFTATPDVGYQVDQWIVDNGIVQTGGTTYTLTNIHANHTVQVTFTTTGTLYSGAQNGQVYYSTNNGQTWTATTTTPSGADNPVLGVVATANALYALSSNPSLEDEPQIYYSNNNGLTWGGVANGASIVSFSVVPGVSLQNEVIYIGLSDGKVFYTPTEAGVIVPGFTNADPCAANPVTAIFANALGTALYAGCSDGTVTYSGDFGDQWTPYTNSPDGTAIHNVFASQTNVFVNTQDEFAYTNVSLVGGISAWIPYGQTVFSLFASSDEQTILAGTQDGFVYSLASGNNLGFITYTPINSVYFFNP